MLKRYSQIELSSLEIEVREGTPLADLEDMFGRPLGGIAQKISAISKKNPDIIEPEVAEEYLREFSRIRYQRKNRKAWFRDYMRGYRNREKILDLRGLLIRKTFILS